jgi:hypothetical protein
MHKQRSPRRASRVYRHTSLRRASGLVEHEDAQPISIARATSVERPAPVAAPVLVEAELLSIEPPWETIQRAETDPRPVVRYFMTRENVGGIKAAPAARSMPQRAAYEASSLLIPGDRRTTGAMPIILSIALAVLTIWLVAH